MLRTIEVEIDEQGAPRVRGPVGRFPAGGALLTLPTLEADDVLRLAEPALAEDWLRPEEDLAWAHLQPATYSCCTSRFRT